MSVVFHSSDYPEYFLQNTPEHLRAALHVYATAVGSMQRPAEEQLADVKLLEQAMGEPVIPSDLERFHRSCLLLFYDALIEHYRVFGDKPRFSLTT